MLTPRQRNQIKAALTFWNAVAETSRVHPIEHPKVQQFFREGDLSSLTAEEIADLLAYFDMNGDEVALATLLHIANDLRVSPARLQTQAKRDGIEPILFRGCSTRLYCPSDLIPSARKIAERDAQTRRKYHATKKPPSTDGNKSG